MEEAAARLGVALIKQYPAREQVELKVRIGCVSKIWARGLAAPQLVHSPPPSAVTSTRRRLWRCRSRREKRMSEPGDVCDAT